MSITILTPLFPPDTGAPAPYVKELSRRLKDYTVKVIAYGHLPESVEGVVITPINKRGLKISLVTKCISYLFRTDSTLLLVNNGPSAELPAMLYSLVSSTPIVLIKSDARATKASTSGAYRFIHKTLARRARAVITLPDESEYLPPETLPFTTPNEAAVLKIESWWKQHVNTLLSYENS